MRLIRLLKRDLATEVATWVEREIISVDQARSICRLYEVDYDAIRSRSTGYRVLVVLGFLFIGLALITVIGANWDEIPRAARMAGLLALTAGTHALALHHHRLGRASLATGLFVLGNLFYGASIILVAQIYHLGEHMPDGVFWWALGSLPFAVLLCSPWLTLMSGLLALIWLYLEYTTGFLSATFVTFVFPLFLAAEPLRAGAGASEHPPVPRVRRRRRPLVPEHARHDLDGWPGTRGVVGRACVRGGGAVPPGPGRPGNGSTQGKAPGQGTTEPCSPSGPCASPSSGCSS